MDLRDRLTKAKDLLIAGEDESEVPDVIGYQDVQHQWEHGYRETLVQAIENGACGPDSTSIIDFPKTDLTVRPVARFSTRDRLIYDALVFTVADQIDRHLHPGVFSYRWDRFKGEPQKWWPNWTSYRAKSLQAIRSDTTLRVAYLDIAAFYEHIDVAILGDDLEAVGGGGRTVGHIIEFLTRFQTINHAWGLPQGPDASGILANLYLAPVDSYLIQNNARFLRYSDDIKVFHPDRSELRDLFLGVNSQLRSRRLAISSSKTVILDPQDARERETDIRHDSLAGAIKRGRPGARENLAAYFEKIAKEGKFNGNQVRFVLGQLRWLRDDRAVGWCLENLTRLPHAITHVFKYLNAAKSRAPEVESALVNFLHSSHSAAHPLIEQRVLRYFIAMGFKDERVKEAAWNVLGDRNRPDYAREFAARYVGQHASTIESQLLRHRFEGETSTAVRRAVLVALHEAGYLSTRYRNEIRASVSGMEWLCSFLAANPYIRPPRIGPYVYF
ncbi:RNA-directed DNA polymerase [Streptomyces sp. PAM3C]|uniref:RNA-directed DNA polymerase n=1 Tax=unclassified Streptomyces TaxID=2593676 RepID=UPI001C1E07E6|nr:RNA-directed DNA polymerase [Streptomyces sp. PAM3C]MBU5946703.1 RNA-directed DNA polymerase [Streptomyces sp. PAM3C]